MNGVDVMVVSLLALADICLIVHLRRRRYRHLRRERMMRSLQLHIRSALAPAVVAPHKRPLLLRAG